KPGYWLPTKDAMVSVVTSPEKPEAVLNIAAKPAPIWHVQTIGEPGDNPIISAMEEANPAARAALLKREYVTWDESPPQAFSELDADGRGMLTQVGTSGGLFVGIVNVPAELVVEPGFDHTNVLSATRMPNSDITEMIDVNDRHA